MRHPGLFLVIFFFLLIGHRAAAENQPGISETETKILAEYENRLITYEQSLIYRLQAIKDPAVLPERFRMTGDVRRYAKSATLLFREAFQALPALSPQSQATVSSLLARPGGSYTYVSPDGYFKLHYDISGTNAVPTSDGDSDGIPDFIENVAGYCDSSWRTEVINLGYLPPPPDGTAGGDALYDIYFEDMDYYGYTAPENYGPNPWDDATSYISLNNNFYGFPPNTDPDGNQWGAAKVTVAHEFFHAVQCAYDYSESAWLMEVGSTWMEDVVFDTVNDNYNYLSYFFGMPQTGLQDESIHMYASFIWNKYLEKQFDISLIRGIWEGCIYSSSITATNDSLGLYGYTFDSAFAEFETWVYRTGARDDGTGFDEADSYPLVSILNTHSTYPTGVITPSTRPEGLAAVFVRFLPGAEDGRLDISFDGADNRDWDVDIIISQDWTTHNNGKMILDPGSQSGVFSVDNYRDNMQIIMCAVNNTEFANATSFSYSADVIQAHSIAVSSTDTVGLAGADNLMAVAIANTSALIDSVAYSITDSLGWSLSETTGDIVFGPGADTVLPVMVTTPVGTIPGTVDRLYITVQSYGDPLLIENRTATIEIVLQHGDANFDGIINVGDAVYVINYVFKDGAEPKPVLDAGDANCDGTVNVGDAVFLINFVFKDGIEPPCNP